jgi:hypothetical protein
MQESVFCASRVVQRLVTLVIRKYSVLADVRHTSHVFRLSSRCRNRVCITVEKCSKSAIAGVTKYCLTGVWPLHRGRADQQKPRVLRKHRSAASLDSSPWSGLNTSKHPQFKGGRKDGRGTDRLSTRLETSGVGIDGRAHVRERYAVRL